LNPQGDEVTRIPGAPGCIVSFATGCLTFRPPADTLSASYPDIRQEPTTTYSTGSLRGVRHGDSIVTTQDQIESAAQREIGAMRKWIIFGERTRIISRKRRI